MLRLLRSDRQLGEQLAAARATDGAQSATASGAAPLQTQCGNQVLYVSVLLTVFPMHDSAVALPPSLSLTLHQRLYHS